MPCVGAGLPREAGASVPGTGLARVRGASPLLHNWVQAQPACKDKCNRPSDWGFASATFPCTIAPLFSG
ncbi:hypothetical protein F3J45_10010 [Pantoea sp. Ap-967]|nr:hypothetical protein [Pantoea sp. Ap-967]